jgi:hypothetical protein
MAYATRRVRSTPQPGSKTGRALTATTVVSGTGGAAFLQPRNTIGGDPVPWVPFVDGARCPCGNTILPTRRVVRWNGHILEVAEHENVRCGLFVEVVVAARSVLVGQ